jgi:hypothetical protein
MPGRMITSVADIMKGIKAQTQEQIDDLFAAFSYVGEACVKEAREQHTYTDQTGNLTSSIGYTIVQDGKILSRSVAQKVKDGDEGVKKGQEYLDSLAEKWGRKGMFLIVSAGMDYAEYVEARGYVVLSSAELKAPNLMREILTKLGFEVKN